jgi:hypothetical protein
VFVHKVLRGIFGSKREKATGKRKDKTVPVTDREGP